MEIVILLLVFGLPILSVILDKNKKKGVPKVKSRPIVWPADKPAAQKKPGSARTAPAKPAADGSTRHAEAPAAPARPAATASEPAPASPASPSPVIPDAGMAAASYMNETRSTASRAAPAVEEPQEKKKFSEKQKLIIYSEIMKPKFDG